MRILIGLLAITAWAQVGGLTIRNTSGSTQTARPITRARVFKQGDITDYPRPRINGVAATSWQADVFNRWPDNSVKFAVISFHSDLSTGSTIAVDFQNSTNACHLGNLAICQAAALDGTGVLAARSSSWAATIAVTNGTTQTANARTMITANEYRYWLRGPVVTQVIVEDLDRGYDMGFASSVLGLHPQFVVTVYPSYTAGVRLEYILENCWTDRLIDQSYSLVVANSAGTQYSRATFTHYAMARWHKGNEAAQIWDGTAPGSVEFNDNLPYLVLTKALPYYDMGLSPSTTTILSSYNASNLGDDFGERAVVTQNMNTTGARSDIGFVYLDQLKALYAASASLDPMFHYLGDVAGHVPIHLREHRTDNYLCSYSCTSTNATVLARGYPVTPQGRPTFNAKDFVYSSSSAADKITVAGTITKGGWTWDQSHHPSLSYLPYLLTGSFFHYEEIQFWASWCKVDMVPEYRNLEWSLGNPKSLAQRGAAWQMRTIGQAAFVSRDNSPEREMWRKQLEWDAEMFEGMQAETSGNYPPADSACPSYTAGNYTPLSGANRSRWCYGKFYPNVNHSNPLHLQLAAEASIDCMTTYWAKFDCAGTYTGRWIALWQQGYWLVATGWINEAVSTAFSKVLQNYHSTYIDAAATTSYLRYTLLGALWTIWTPNQTSAIAYPTTLSQYEGFIVPASGSSTTLTGSALSSSGTSFTVADYTKLSHKPVWRRTGASGAITAISVSSGTVTLTFSTAHGLAVGDRIQTSGHTTTGLNTGSTIRNITATPSATQLSYQYVTTLPADGSYTVESGFFAKTPGQNLVLQIDSENVQVCSIETDGTVTIGSNSSTASVSGVCTATASSTRGLYFTSAASHSAGATVRAPYEVWQQGDNLAGGYNWIIRGALSYAYGWTTGSSTGSALWTWIDTNMKTPLQSYYTAQQEPAWAISPRAVPQFSITTTGLPAGTVGVAYSQTLATAGASGSVTWSIVAGALPAGMSLNASTGAITGTPSGTYSALITVRATDSSAATRDATFGLAVTSTPGPVISPSSLPSGTVGSSYSQTFSATGGTAPYSWSNIAGPLPPGLTISSSGLLSGNPTTGGNYTFTIRVTDAVSVSTDQVYTISIAWLPLSITTGATLPQGTIGVAYSTTLAANGGSGSYTWTFTGGTSPGGLSLVTATGVIYGYPNTPGSYSFTVQCASTDGQTASRTFSLLVPAPAGFRTVMKGIKGGGVIVR